MKKLMRMVVLCVVLALSLTIGAYAAESSPLSIEAEDVSAASTELTIRVRLTAPVTDGVFRFRDEPLSMIVSRLEKYYGIEIAVDDSLGSVRYTGAFPLEQKITEVLETLNFEKRFTVVQHGNDFALEKK